MSCAGSWIRCCCSRASARCSASGAPPPVGTWCSASAPSACAADFFIRMKKPARLTHPVAVVWPHSENSVGFVAAGPRRGAKKTLATGARLFCVFVAAIFLLALAAAPARAEALQRNDSERELFELLNHERSSQGLT